MSDGTITMEIMVIAVVAALGGALVGAWLSILIIKWQRRREWREFWRSRGYFW